MNLIPGAAEDQSAFWSKLGAIAGVLAAVVSVIIVHFHNIQHGSIELALDGESAKDSAASAGYFLAEQASFDIIIQDIHHRLELLRPITVKNSDGEAKKTIKE